MIDIMPLTEENMDEAIIVLDQEFGKDSEDPCDPEAFDSYQKWLPASLSTGQVSQTLKSEYDTHDLKHWVARDSKTQKIVGVTGIFTEPFAPGVAWLAWTSALRTSPTPWPGIEESLVSFSAAMARSLGKRYLAIYSADGEEDNWVERFRDLRGFLRAEDLKKKGATMTKR